MRHSKLKLILPLSLAAFGGLLQAQEYDSKGKRDPFANLAQILEQRPAEIVGPPPLNRRPPGLPGLLIQEVNVAGTAANGHEKIVILKGIDDFTYLGRTGSKLFDGYLESIMGDQVVFLREITDTRGNKTTRKVVKRFYTEDQ
ncbi:MAG: hypothetical protein ACRD1R_14205 [Acidobacteriota bacterium]